MATYQQIREMWKGYHIHTTDQLEKCLDNFRILFAYHSGKIENEKITYHDTREIFKNGKVLNFTGDPRTLFEQQNQKLCYEYLKQKIVDREPVTIPLVKEVHGILTAGSYDETRFLARQERPGAFKRHDYVTGRNEVGSAPEDVERDLTELLKEVNDYQGDDVLKAAAYFHVRFEYIHPFADGNGRVGRTLLNYYLMTHKEPPLIVYDEDKKAYYAALERYDTEEDLQSMCEFLIAETEKTWEKTLEREQKTKREKRKTLSELDR